MGFIRENKSTNILIVLGAVMALTGCAGSPVHLAGLSQVELQEFDTLDICHAYSRFLKGSSVIKNMEAELKKRKAIKAKNWKSIKENKIRIGMNECELFASWGDPSRLSYSNTNKSCYEKIGCNVQYVYRPNQYGSAQYVYVENGKVRAWQD